MSTIIKLMVRITKTPYIIAKIPYITALRPRQWTKNLIVFAAPLFAFSINWSSFLSCLLAFILFCCTSSSFYLLNDILDVEADRRHPVKCKRPIAAGLVSIPVAFAMAVALLGSALIFGWLRSPALGLECCSPRTNLCTHPWLSALLWSWCRPFLKYDLRIYYSFSISTCNISHFPNRCSHDWVIHFRSFFLYSYTLVVCLWKLTSIPKSTEFKSLPEVIIENLCLLCLYGLCPFLLRVFAT